MSNKTTVEEVVNTLRFKRISVYSLKNVVDSSGIINNVSDIVLDSVPLYYLSNTNQRWNSIKNRIAEKVIVDHDDIIILIKKELI